MKPIFYYFVFLFIFLGCNPARDTESKTQAPVQKADTGFFPVTRYLKGQIHILKQNGINPLKKTIKDGHVIDSAWLKIENLEWEFKDFLLPEIDTTNLLDYFKESRFLDKSLGMYTFTYEPIKKLPSNLQLTRWDVYISEETSEVSRVFIVKDLGDTIKQLTWNPGHGTSTVTIIKGKQNKDIVHQEININWSF